MEKDVIKKISDQSIPMAEVIQYLLKKYPDKFAMDLFLEEMKNEIKNRYNEALLNLTDQDILNFIEYYKQSNWELPSIKLNEAEYNHTRYFIRNIRGYQVISNIYNFGKDKEADFIELIFLNEMLIKHHFVIDWHFGLSVAEEMNQIELLQNIRIKLEAYLKPDTPKKQIKKPELTLRQVALFYIYNGEHITTENNNIIAKEYGHNSGHRLQQQYNDFYKSNSRKSSESIRKDKRLLNDIEKVIEHLPIENQGKPKKEAELLRNKVQNNDYISL